MFTWWRRALVAVSLFVGAGAAAADKCELAQPLDCLQRGLALLEADPPDASGALVWVAKACTSKHPDGCAQLGFMYMSALGTAADDMQAFTFSKQGCDLGSALGCKNAAVLTRDGRGTKKDVAQTMRFFDLACQHDDVEACEIMGWSYFQGDNGLKQDLTKAVAALDKTCKLGNGEICNQLGVSYLKGSAGLTADRQKALAFFSAGCAAKNSDACDNQKLVASEPDPAEAGKVEAVLGQRVGKRVNIKVSGQAPPVGVEGDVSKQVEQAGFTMWLVIGHAKVVKSTGQAVELEVVSEKSEVVIDGKKVNHWTAGSKLTFEWK